MTEVGVRESTEAPLKGRNKTMQEGYEEEIVVAPSGEKADGTQSKAAPTPSISEQRNFWDAHWQQSKERKVLNDWTERRATEILG